MTYSILSGKGMLTIARTCRASYPHPQSNKNGFGISYFAAPACEWRPRQPPGPTGQPFIKLESANRTRRRTQMKRNVAVFGAFLGLMAGTASAQMVGDVRSVLEASLKAMGGNLK